MSGQSAGKYPHTEHNNQPQGRSGSKVPLKNGPATGRKGHVNATKSGGIFRPTKSN